METNPETKVDAVAADNNDNGFAPQWGTDAPRGGKSVLNRILKDGAKVPLFLGQTLINSLRDLGYNNTTSALCEHVDNAIQWGATEVRVFFHQTGKRGDYHIDCLVLDNGQGMAPYVLKVAMSFGGSMVYENRNGIGRYGMGMKAAALNIGRVLDVYSWQELGAIYNMTLDVDEISGNRSNLIEQSDPVLCDDLPSDIADILTKPMEYPKRPAETQELFANGRAELSERLGQSGTIVYIPDCDRLSHSKSSTLVDHATKEMGRIYRRQIEAGLKLYVNNRRIEAFDPTYWMKSARHAQIEGLQTTQSRLVRSWQIDVPVEEGSVRTSKVGVKLYMLPFEEWGALPRKVLKNDLHVFDDYVVSFMRNDREVAIGSESKLRLKRHHTNNWLRLQVDFTGELDEGCGVAANKQGVRLKQYVADAIVAVINDDVTELRQNIQRLKSERAQKESKSKISEAERRATDADALQGKPLPADTPEEQAALEQNLRALAVGLKRDGESDEEAFDRIKTSKYVTVFRHDEYWPFYHCDFKFGKVILTINTAHPFFKKIWEPLSELARRNDLAVDGEDEGEGGVADDGVGHTCAEVLVSLQLVLHSLARTQASMGTGNDEAKQLFEKLRREWSGNLETQLKAK